MLKLNFPAYTFRFKSSENKFLIFDRIRKKFVILQPEEWVRQHVVEYLIQEKGYPQSHINVEKQVPDQKIKKRYDVVVFHPDGRIAILVECKAPEQPINQQVFDQIARYNLQLDAGFLMVTNGLSHYYCRMDFIRQRYEFLPGLPSYSAS